MEIKRVPFPDGKERYTCFTRLNDKQNRFMLSTRRPTIDEYLANAAAGDPYRVIHEYTLITLTRDDFASDPSFFSEVSSFSLIKALNERGIKVKHIFNLTSNEQRVQWLDHDTIQVRALFDEDLQDVELGEKELELYKNLVVKQKASKLFKELYLEVFRNALKPLHLDIVIENNYGMIKFNSEYADSFIEEIKAKCNVFGLPLNTDNSRALSWNLSFTDIIQFDIHELDFIKKDLEEVI